MSLFRINTTDEFYSKPKIQTWSEEIFPFTFLLIIVITSNIQAGILRAYYREKCIFSWQ